jgi:16S rRNA (cytosine967-C5)-methyltransferase
LTLNGRFYSYLNTAQTLLREYKGDIPFHQFSRQFFRNHGKYGSRDRKQISALCYAYFRTGRALQELSIEQKIRISFFLCSEKPNEMLGFFDAGWNQLTELSQRRKADHLLEHGIPLRIDEIFPLADHLSKAIVEEREAFILSHLQQPDLFLRIRPGHEHVVMKKMESANIPGSVSGNTITLPNNTDASSIFEIDRDVVIQDHSSQQTGDFILLAASSIARKKTAPRVWDCCAASGGKSLLAIDLMEEIKLTVSDTRSSILENLHERFNKAGVKTYQAFEADLSRPLKGNNDLYDLIIADVPCSGSGTWGRTPEELIYFSADKLSHYAALQRKIISNTIPYLVAGGQYLYFTCSVYREENEEAVDFLVQNYGFSLNRMESIKGYKNRADSMFAAWLTSPG